MTFVPYQWIALAILFQVSHAPSVIGQDAHIFEIGGGVAFSGTNQKSVSHGHTYLVSGKPGFIFGGVQAPDGQWKLNYLFLIKHSATADTEFEHGNPDPATSSDSSNGTTRFLRFNERLRFGPITSEFSYESDYNVASDQLIKERMTLMGKRADLKDGRVIVVDMTADPVTMQQIKVGLPAAKDVNFLNSTREDYSVFTDRWFAEIAKASEVVAIKFKQ